MEIIRLITETNREGNQEIFFHVLFNTTEYGKITFGHWLTPTEYQTYITDNSTLVDIIESYRTKAIMLYEKSLIVSNME